MRVLALIDGVMFGALGRHVIAAFVSAPAWLVLSVACLIGYGLLRYGRSRTTLPWMAAGAVCAFTLPATLEPPRAAVVTHAPAWIGGVDLFDALQKLDDDPQALLGREISVSGSWRTARRGWSAAVYRRVMACCAADAVDVGFDVEPMRPISLPPGSIVRVSGRVTMTLRDGETRYVLRSATVGRQ